MRLEGEKRRLLEDVKLLRQRGSVPPSPRGEAKAIHQLRTENKALEHALQQSKMALQQYQNHMAALQARLQGSEATMHMLNSRNVQQQQQLFHMQRSVSQSSLGPGPGPGMGGGGGGGRSRTSSVRSHTSDFSVNRVDDVSLPRIQGSASGSPVASYGGHGAHSGVFDMSDTAAEDRAFVSDTRLVARALAKSLDGAMGPGQVNCAIALGPKWDGEGNPFLFHLNRVGHMLIPRLIKALIHRIGRENMVLVGGSAWNVYLATPLDTDDVDFTVRASACAALHDNVTAAVIEVLSRDDVCSNLASLQQVGGLGWSARAKRRMRKRKRNERGR